MTGEDSDESSPTWYKYFAPSTPIMWAIIKMATPNTNTIQPITNHSAGILFTTGCFACFIVVMLPGFEARETRDERCCNICYKLQSCNIVNPVQEMLDN